MNPLKRHTITGLALAAAAAVSFTANRVGAQEPDPPAEVAKQFMNLLSVHDHLGRSDDEALRRLISDKSITQLQESGAAYLLSQLQAGLVQPQWVAETQTAPDGTTVAKVSPAPASPSRDVVLVQEGRQWHVDLAATYAHWNNLTPDQMQPVLAQAKASIDKDQRARCQSNMKQIALGFMQYIQDYDELYPPANKWCDVLQPYIKSEAILHCPTTGPGNYGYAMNWKLSRRSGSEVTMSGVTTLLYESTNLRRNQAGPGNDIAYRHLGGANYAFVDGHVKWLLEGRPQEFRLAPKPVRRDDSGLLEVPGGGGQNSPKMAPSGKTTHIDEEK